MINLEEYRKDILNNLFIMSRTANGFIDLSSFNGKVKSMAITDGELAKDIVFSNYNKAIDLAYDNRYRCFSNANELKEFIETIALTINDGIILKNKLYRNGSDSPAFHYVKASEIEKTLYVFLNKLLSLFNTADYDPLYASALSEYYINYRGHFFSDGCFKTCMIISAYCLMRAGVKVANYVSQNFYFEYAPLPDEDDNGNIIRHFEYIKLIHTVKDYIVKYQQETDKTIDRYDVFKFPNDDLLTMVLNGTKTATSSLYDVYEYNKINLPFQGLYSVILDKNNIPKCIIVDDKVDIKPFKNVEKKYARKEGEGDQTLAYWRLVHEVFFKKEAVNCNAVFSEDSKIVLEEFRVLYNE